MPSKKIKDQSLFGRINSHFSNFSWGKCLLYPHEEERNKYCPILFFSETEIERCGEDFCSSCCSLFVDRTNGNHLALCNKQCNLTGIGKTPKDALNQCGEPKNPDRSIYPYCDDYFKGDFFGSQRCKTDMCNLCCITREHGEMQVDEVGLTKCYSDCTKNFGIIPFNVKNDS